MRIRHSIVILSLLLSGCDPKIVGYLGITDSGAADTSSGPNDDGTSEAGDTSDQTTSADTSTTSTGATTTSAGTTTTGGEDSGVPAECLAIDHETCFDAAIDACAAQGNWDVTQACVDAVQDCYPIGTQVLAAADVVLACQAETDGCLHQNAPGCGETFCTCTVGAHPYDWNNCWHLLFLACSQWATSDCEAVLAGCYPTATVSEYEECRQQIIVVNPEVDCNCAQCGDHEQCEDALDACLGA